MITYRCYWTYHAGCISPIFSLFLGVVFSIVRHNPMQITIPRLLYRRWESIFPPSRHFLWIISTPFGFVWLENFLKIRTAIEASSSQSTGCCYCCCCPVKSPPTRPTEGQFIHTAFAFAFYNNCSELAGLELMSMRDFTISLCCVSYADRNPEL